MMGGTGSMISGLGMLGMWVPLLLWAVLLALLAGAFVRMPRGRERLAVARVKTVEEVLRERLARGEISAREYEDALRLLRGS